MGITLEELQKQRKEREEVKSKLESSYFQVIGQIQLLDQQIEDVMKKEQKTEEPK